MTRINRSNGAGMSSQPAAQQRIPLQTRIAIQEMTSQPAGYTEHSHEYPRSGRVVHYKRPTPKQKVINAIDTYLNPNKRLMGFSATHQGQQQALQHIIKAQTGGRYNKASEVPLAAFIAAREIWGGSPQPSAAGDKRVTNAQAIRQVQGQPAGHTEHSHTYPRSGRIVTYRRRTPRQRIRESIADYINPNKKLGGFSATPQGQQQALQHIIKAQTDIKSASEVNVAEWVNRYTKGEL